MNKPFDDRIYLEMFLKSMELDGLGNPIIVVEASNENLDQQDQKVLQRALLDSRDYFMRNGVISYDHRHLRRDASDPDWNPEKYIIGEPIAVEAKGTRTFVKARLFQSNPIVKEIISKLKDGAKYLKASVGGMRPVVENAFDSKLKRPMEHVVSVLWNELAITPKPVNDTLSPVSLSSAAFVKSLSMGYTTDSACATGGAALGLQSLEGAHRRRKEAIHVLLTGIAVGDVKTPEAGIELLANHGVEDSKEASDILEEIVNRRKKIQEVFRMDANLSKALDDSIAELEKAMKGNGGGLMPPDPTSPPAPRPRPVPRPKQAVEPEPEENEEEGEGEEFGEGEGEYGNPAQKSMSDDVEYLDVSPILAEFAKSLADVRKENKELANMVKAQGALIKSMGSVQLQTAQFMKSLTGTPTMRKSVLSRNPRFGENSDQGGEMSRDEILRKSTIAVRQGKMDIRQASILEDRLNKGMEIEAETLSMLKALN